MREIASNPPRKHHYIPKFYTKQWADTAGKICEFSRPHMVVIERRKHTDGVGYQRGLYDPGLRCIRKENSLEVMFFSPIDNRGHEAVNYLLSHREQRFPKLLRVALCQLLISLMHRTPDRLHTFKEKLASNAEEVITALKIALSSGQKDAIPLGTTLEEVVISIRKSAGEESLERLLVSVIDSKQVATHLINMRWYVREVCDAKHSFLTSDKPIVHYNGIGLDAGHLAIALSPTILLFCTNNEATARNISWVSDSYLVRRFNHEVVSQAENYVYGNTASHLRFVERRLQCKPRISPPIADSRKAPSSQWLIP